VDLRVKGKGETRSGSEKVWIGLYKLSSRSMGTLTSLLLLDYLDTSIFRCSFSRYLDCTVWPI
jgi:hypothetical protein